MYKNGAKKNYHPKQITDDLKHQHPNFADLSVFMENI